MPSACGTVFASDRIRKIHLMGIFNKPPFSGDGGKRNLPEGLWQKCPSCGEIIHNLELQQNFRVCPKCDHHFTQSARERIDMLCDDGTFEEHDKNMASVDTLKFTGMASYTDRLKSYQKKTGLKDAVITGLGKIDGQPLATVIDYLAITFIVSLVGCPVVTLPAWTAEIGRASCRERVCLAV